MSRAKRPSRIRRQIRTQRLALCVSAALTPATGAVYVNPPATASHGTADWAGVLQKLRLCDGPLLGALYDCEDLTVATAAQRILPPLRSALDSALQREMDALVSRPHLLRAVHEERFSAALVDITDIYKPRLAMINGDLMQYAASLPKIAILLGVFDAVASGDLTMDEATLDAATRMIRNSSNTAATQMYYAVGPERLAGVLQSPRYRLYNRDWGGGLWVGKPYAKRDTWRRDPIANLSHGATAFQVARFFYLLEAGQLVSPEASSTMKSMLGSPAIRHKFVKGLAGARPGSVIFRKSGTWRTYHSDGAIVERDGRRYIAVVMANDVAGSQWLSELIVDFDTLIHAGAGAMPAAAPGPTLPGAH